MIGITGMYFQTLVQGTGILHQLGEAFSVPSDVAKAGYFFPTEGTLFHTFFPPSSVTSTIYL